MAFDRLPDSDGLRVLILWVHARRARWRINNGQDSSHRKGGNPSHAQLRRVLVLQLRAINKSDSYAAAVRARKRSLGFWKSK